MNDEDYEFRDAHDQPFSDLEAARCEITRLRAENTKLLDLVQRAFVDGWCSHQEFPQIGPCMAWDGSRSKAILEPEGDQ